MNMDVELTIRRGAHFWRGVTPEAVGAYLRALRKEKKLIEDCEFALPRPFRMSTEACRDVLVLLDREIRLGEFYFELRGKQKEAGFDTWVFTLREQRQPRSDWDTPKGDAWTRSNGRVKAEIGLEKKRTMTRVSLRLKNDSDQLTFYDPPTGGEVCHRFLRNEQRIQHRFSRAAGRSLFLVGPGIAGMEVLSIEPVE